MNWDIKEIGTFTLSSGTMRISDPSYDKTSGCSGTIPNCVTGEWQAGVAYHKDTLFGRRVALLVAKAANSSVRFDLANDIYALNLAQFEVGGDSGQAGMFDDASYGLDSTVEDLPRALSPRASCPAATLATAVALPSTTRMAIGRLT